MEKSRRKRISCCRVGWKSLIYLRCEGRRCLIGRSIYQKSQQIRTPKVKPEGTKPTMVLLTLERKVCRGGPTPPQPILLEESYFNLSRLLTGIKAGNLLKTRDLPENKIILYLCVITFSAKKINLWMYVEGRQGRRML